MYIELVDSLRCITAHEDSWLVASADEMVGRHIRTGVLGCPVCRAQYPIRDFVVEFGAAVPSPVVVPASPGEVERIVALLSLAEPGGAIVLGASHVALASAVNAEAEVSIVVLDPPPTAVLGPGISGISGAPHLPFGSRSLRGIVLDERTATGSWLDSAVHALRPGGRLLAPASAPIPRGLTRLAADDRQWLAERDAAIVSEPVTLRARGARRAD